MQFPEIKYPPHFLPSEGIGGEYGTTAVLPTIDEIIEWKEGRVRYTRGYYRLVDGPALSRLQHGLAAHFGVRYGLVYTSGRTALLELLDQLLHRHAQAKVKVVTEIANPRFSFLVESLQALRQPVICAPENKPESLAPFSTESLETLLIAVVNPESWITRNREWLESVRKEKISVTVFTPSLNALEKFPLPADYWVSGLEESGEDDGLDGGVILSSKDRQMAELTEVRKKRGGILSQRDASAWIERLQNPATMPPPRPSPKGGGSAWDKEVIRRMCELENAEHGFLLPSGMSAITAVISLLRRPATPKVIVLGLLYTDSYGFLERTYSGQSNTTCYLQVSETDKLEEVLDGKTACILTETITNPLLQTPDLKAISRIAKERDIPPVVDTTLATPFNCRPLELGADYVIHSSAKYLCGNNDHGGGVALTGKERWAWPIRQFQRQWALSMSSRECGILSRRLLDFEERMERFNRNGETLAGFLKNHPAVDRVHHGSLNPPSTPHAGGMLSGFGSVVSFVLKADDLEGLSAFYDGLPPPILKAPSLGSDRTLVCPYALLAHYHEPQSFFREHGISLYMVRVAAGCEKDFTPVLESLEAGLKAAIRREA